MSPKGGKNLRGRELEKLRGNLVSARRQQVAKALGSKRLPSTAPGRLETTQEIIDALDRAIG